MLIYLSKYLRSLMFSVFSLAPVLSAITRLLSFAFASCCLFNSSAAFFLNKTYLQKLVNQSFFM